MSKGQVILLRKTMGKYAVIKRGKLSYYNDYDDAHLSTICSVGHVAILSTSMGRYAVIKGNDVAYYDNYMDAHREAQMSEESPTLSIKAILAIGTMIIVGYLILSNRYGY